MTSKYPQNEKADRSGIECSQFEALLADALDGALTAKNRSKEKLAFDAHARSCSLCGPMLAEVQEGLRLLECLEDVEPPKNMLHNILAATSLAEDGSMAQAVTAPSVRWKLRPMVAGFFRSRFVTSFCMAFFSLSLTLTVAGVKISDITKVDWRPNALRKAVVLQYTQVESSVLKYYDNMRFVNEVGSRVKALRKATATPEGNDQNEKDKNDKPKKDPNGTSGNPEPHPDYSMARDVTVTAEVKVRSEGAQI